MKSLLILVLLFISLGLSAQPQNAFRWANQVPLNYPSLATDLGGNTVVTGSFTQPITINGKTVAPYGLEDVFVGRYSASGQLLWFTHIGGTGAKATGQDVAVDAAGNAYVAGVFNGTVNQNVAGTPLTMSDIIYASSYSLPFLVKVSPTGQTVWARQGKDRSGDIQSTSAVRVAVDPLGNATIIGYGTSTLTFGSITVGGNRTGIMVHFDAAGTATWGHTFSSSVTTLTRGIGADGSGNTYLTVRVTGNPFMDGQSIPGPVLTSVILAKFSGSSGALLWAAPITNADNTDLAVDLAGHATLIGPFSGAAQFSSRTLTSSSLEVYVARYNPDASLDWVRSLEALNSGTERIATNWAGSSVVALVNTSASPTHAKLLELNTHSGAVTWRQELGPGSTSGSNLAISPLEQVYVAGSFSGVLELGRTTLTSPTGAYFLTRIDRGPRGNSPHFADLISCYPNPTTTYLKLKLPAQYLPARAALFHMSGREVFSQALKANETELNMRSVKPGLYTLRVQLPDGVVTQQIQVK
ncbi:Por secretion system C-terminal sorting domain-containing protein [Hymenobacter gelipurpurascens]|uniref:Por secretion system C-terminal sorting domain-containing protein n=1 Tax=Hymenobacter gelipurpurascens TaxID=89968 RepID=A0A212UCF6_9BACT|nr:SBBP repeat-containing protein [Hymenobacter gelipurpurascens]SNC75919.1 Por secretion system C-terminal sorting domain-containing protein [Hymenobacter gelipurpurascens]